MNIINNNKISIEIKGYTNKYHFDYIKRQLKILSNYILPCDKKVYIIAENDIENSCANIDISTYILNEEVNIVITIDTNGNQRPMNLKCFTHTFSSFSTDFLETSTDNIVRIVCNGKCWSPVISLGVMYIYFVNFFIEYIIDNKQN